MFMAMLITHLPQAKEIDTCIEQFRVDQVLLPLYSAAALSSTSNFRVLQNLRDRDIRCKNYTIPNYTVTDLFSMGKRELFWSERS